MNFLPIFYGRPLIRNRARPRGNRARGDGVGGGTGSVSLRFQARLSKMPAFT